MNTAAKLLNLRSKALSKSQTLTSLRAEFADLCEQDNSLAALEFNHNWCSVSGNSVTEARKTKAFDVFALHVNKLADILNPIDEWDFLEA